MDFLAGAGYTFLYILICLPPALLIRKLTKIPDEVFRKLLHCIAISSIFCYVYAFAVWYHAVIFCGFFVVVGYPTMLLMERFKTYSRMMNERKKGEMKNSMIVVFLMFMIVLSVCWGWFNDKLLAVASVLAWGFGDAAAALVGKQYGKHKISGSGKSLEGTLSMFAVSFFCTLVPLVIRGGMPFPSVLLTAFLTAVVSAATELYTPGGYDTITCPVGAMIVLLSLTRVFGGSV